MSFRPETNDARHDAIPQPAESSCCLPRWWWLARGAAVFLLLGIVPVFAQTRPVPPGAAISGFMDDLVYEMMDPEGLARITGSTEYGVVSSAKRDGPGPNFDNYVSVDEKGVAVLADLKGPGCVRRMFFSGAIRRREAGDGGKKGKKGDSAAVPVEDHLQKPRELFFYFDGEAKPRIKTTVQDLMNDLAKGENYSVWQSLWPTRTRIGEYPLQPLAGISGNAYFSYLPIPYAKSLKITMDAADLRGFSYQIGYHTYAVAPAGLKSYSRDALSQALEDSELLARLNDPEVTPVTGFKLRKAVCPDQELAPGSEMVREFQGPAMIRELEIRWTRSDTARMRGLVLRVWWDDEKEPSVELPVDDLFGFDHGSRTTLRLYPINREDGEAGSHRGRLWLPMPFEKKARLVLANENGQADGSIPCGLSILWKPLGSRRWGRWDPAFGQLHARFGWTAKQAGRTEAHRVLDVAGPGRFIGCMLMVNKDRSNRDYLMTPETMTVDGVAWGGTTMDNFFNGFNAYSQRFSAAFHGVPIQRKGNVTQFRFFIPDSISFKKSFALSFPYADENFASVAFWYQKEPHAAGAPLPVLAERSSFYRRFKLPGALEAEELLVKQYVSPIYTEMRIVSMEDEDGDWSNESQLLMQTGARDPVRGSFLMVEFPVAKAGRYELIAHVTKGQGYTPVKFLVDGKACKVKAGDAAPVDAYDAAGDAYVPSGPLSLGTFDLSAGAHTLELSRQFPVGKIPGRDAADVAPTQIGFDCIQLVPR